MDVTPLVRQGHQIIQSYSDGCFRISGQVIDGAVIVLPDEVLFWKVDRDVSDLCVDDFQVLTARSDDIDVVLLGCGTEIAFLPIALRNSLKEQGIHVEVMDTGAACRTYNVLMAEGRRVAAALLPA